MNAIKIDYAVNIEIDEKTIKQLIVDQIARQNPALVVRDVTFTQRRNPPSIEAKVDAYFEDGSAPAALIPVTSSESEEQGELALANTSEAVDDTDYAAEFTEEEEPSEDDLLGEEETEEEPNPFE